MPTIEEHVRRSAARTGKGYQAVHEWIDDKDQDRMADKHDLKRMLEHAESVRSGWGKEAANEYVLHICDDIQNVLLLKGLLTPETAEAIALFGIKSDIKADLAR